MLMKCGILYTALALNSLNRKPCYWRPCQKPTTPTHNGISVIAMCLWDTIDLLDVTHAPIDWIVLHQYQNVSQCVCVCDWIEGCGKWISVVAYIHYYHTVHSLLLCVGSLRDPFLFGAKNWKEYEVNDIESICGRECYILVL